MAKHRKDENDSQREIENLRRGGKGKGDDVAKGLQAWRKDVDSEPLKDFEMPDDK